MPDPTNLAPNEGLTASAPPPIDWRNLIWVVLALGVMIAVIVSGDLFALNCLHVVSGLMWTGIDLVLGFLIGPILRQVPFEARRSVMVRLTPRTMFILPALAIITGTTGWYLAGMLGYLATPYPGYWWVIAALTVVALLTISGIGLLLPTQIRVYLELSKPEPDRERIGQLTASYFYLIVFQCVLQIAIIVIMAKFRTGL